MSFRRLFGLCCVTILSVAASASAELIEFSFGGTITNASGFPNVNPGDPLSVSATFDSATPDLEPSSSQGTYRCSNFRAEANGTLLMEWSSPVPAIHVYDGPKEDSFGIFAFIPNEFDFLQVDFPPSAFRSDALPTGLDLASATQATLNVYNFGPNASGVLTTFSSSVVPEPSVAVYFGAAAMGTLLSRRIRPILAFDY